MGTSKNTANISRASRKAKRRELEDAIPDLPIDNELEASANEIAVSSKKRKRSDQDERVDAPNRSPSPATNEDTKETKKGKKKRRKLTRGMGGVVRDESMAQDTEASQPDTEPATQAREQAAFAVSDVVPKKSKKERKAERRAREAAGQTQAEAGDEALVNEGNANKVRRGNLPGQNDQVADGGNSGVNVKARRFIVFVGTNLRTPFCYQASEANV